MLNKLVIGYLAFILKGELRHHCGTCSIKVKLTTFLRELWKWVLVVSTAGNVKGCSGFSFLWLKKKFKIAAPDVLLHNILWPWEDLFSEWSRVQHSSV